MQTVRLFASGCQSWPTRGKDLHDPSRIAPLLRSDLDYPELIVEQKFGRQRAIDAFKTARASL